MNSVHYTFLDPHITFTVYSLYTVLRMFVIVYWTWTFEMFVALTTLIIS